MKGVLSIGLDLTQRQVGQHGHMAGLVAAAGGVVAGATPQRLAVKQLRQEQRRGKPWQDDKYAPQQLFNTF